MQVNDDLINHLSRLSKLSFPDESRESIKTDLTRILNFVDKLNEVDTTGVEPLIFLSEEKNVFRADEAKMEISREDALKNAPDKDSDFFKVPRYVENKD